MVTNTHDVVDATLKSTPAIAGAVWSLWGFTLQEWAAVATITYTLLMTLFLLIDRYKKWKEMSNK